MCVYVLVLSVLAALSSFPFPSYAETTSAPPTCDPNVMSAIKTRAHVNRAQDATNLQTMVPPPDSVFEIMRYDQSLANIANTIGLIFIENPEYNSINYDVSTESGDDSANTSSSLGVEPLDAAIQEHTLKTLRKYIKNNYLPALMGGELLPGGVLDPKIEAKIRPEGYNNSLMSLVWQATKCRNPSSAFWAPGTDSDPTSYSFEDLASADPRNRPTTAGCKNGTGVTEDMLAQINNQDADGNRFAYHDMDRLQLLAGNVKWGDCENSKIVQMGSTGVRDDPVLDGGRVVDIDRTEYAAGVCLNMGCAFVLDENGEGKCE